MPDPQRVVVFCDWQNIYRRAREANSSAYRPPAQFGQVVPSELGRLLTSRGPKDEARVLQEVRIYRGMPKQEHDPISYKAARSQIAEWSKNLKVTSITRPVVYPQDWETGANGERPREKGIDVALAVDVVTMAARGQYDVGIVFSSDNDLLPAVEFVAGMAASATTAPRIEVAAWEGRPDSRRPNRLNPRGHRVWCHWLSTEDYFGIEDTNVYPLQTPPPTGNRPMPRPPQRWP